MCKEQAEHVVGESQQNVQSVGVVGRVVQPAAERTEQQGDGVVTERVDDVRIRAAVTQHPHARLDLVTTQAHSAYYPQWDVN